MFTVGSKIGEFEILDILGEGAEGRVFKVRWQSRRGEKIAALKILKTHDFRGILKEVSNWARVSQHENILNFYKADLEKGVFYTVSEFAGGGDLDEWIIHNGGKAEFYAEAVDIILGALEGLHHLHQHDIIHRDIKPSNIFLRDGIPVLADFGLARGLNFSQSTVIGGTNAFMSPELVKKFLAIDNGKTLSYERNEADDLWAMGATFQQLLTGKWAFAGMQQIVNCQPNPLPGDAPPVIKKFIQKTFRQEIGERFPSALEMGKALYQIKIELLTIRATSREKELEQKLEQLQQAAEAREAALKDRLRAAGVNPDAEGEISDLESLEGEPPPNIRKLAAATTKELKNNESQLRSGIQLVSGLAPDGQNEALRLYENSKKEAAPKHNPAVTKKPQGAMNIFIIILLVAVSLVTAFLLFTKKSEEPSVETVFAQNASVVANTISSANTASNTTDSMNNANSMSNAVSSMSNAVNSTADSANTNSISNTSVYSANSIKFQPLRTGAFYEKIGNECRNLDYDCRITNYKAAVNAFLLPSNTAYAKLGFAYKLRADLYKDSIKADDYKSAVEAFTEHVKLKPEDYEGYYGLGLIQHELAQYNKAIENFSIAIRKNKKSYSVYQARAETYNKLEKNYQVKADCLKYKQYYPTLSFGIESVWSHGVCKQFMGLSAIPPLKLNTWNSNNLESIGQKKKSLVP